MSRARQRGCDGALGAGAPPRPPAGPPCSPLAHLAVEARVALRAGALVGPVAVLAGATVQAGPRVALVDVVLTVAAREARRTQAGEGVDAIHTGAAIKARAAGEQAAGETGERGWGPCPGSSASTHTVAGGAQQPEQAGRSLADLRAGGLGLSRHPPPASSAFFTTRACGGERKNENETRTRTATAGEDHVGNKGREH